MIDKRVVNIAITAVIIAMILTFNFIIGFKIFSKISIDNII